MPATTTTTAITIFGTTITNIVVTVCGVTTTTVATKPSPAPHGERFKGTSAVIAMAECTTPGTGPKMQRSSVIL